jgi:carbamoyl-phosphate synthase small subunit
MTATLVLQDGTILHGQGFGAAADAVFELVFNTSMTGYQEILTDPSYRGQAVLFTCSHIGNVGINSEDKESAGPQVAAAVVCSLSPLVSNWRATRSLSDWLAGYGVPGISGVDTRYLTRKLRDGGTQKAALSTCGTAPKDLLKLAQEWSGLDGRDTVKEVSCPNFYAWEGDPGDKWVPQSSIHNPQSTIPSPYRCL